MIQIQPDTAKNIRHGEELDMGILNHFLQNQLANFGEIIDIKQFPGGYSNLTYQITTSYNEYVLRRAPFGANIKSAHDMGREYKVLSILKPLYKAVPKTVIFCEDEAIIGSTFYLMEKVNGVILRGKNAKNYQIEPENMKMISELLIDNLADLHKINIENTELVHLGKPDGYVERQITGWIGRYEKSKTDYIPQMDEIANWMNTNMPKPQKPTFIHNDYKYDNVIFDANLEKIIAVLDWEMATLGDPLMDLGATLAYWCEASDGNFLKTMNLTWLPGNINRQEVIARYATKTGIDVSDILFYYVFGLYKNAVIIQQIYARWKLGLTKDPRFEFLILGVNELSNMAAKSIEKNNI
jgi:aminoglycoside phosphotransferase (APT) family kinase protein